MTSTSSTSSGPATASALTQWLDTWATAERRGDAATLDTLLHEEFRGVGPFGFVLDRGQWLQRFADGLHYAAFTFTPDGDARQVAGATVVIGTQQQTGSYQGRPSDGAFRVTLILTDGPQWQLLGAHLSLRTPPAPPAPNAAS